LGTGTKGWSEENRSCPSLSPPLLGLDGKELAQALVPELALELAQTLAQELAQESVKVASPLFRPELEFMLSRAIKKK